MGLTSDYKSTEFGALPNEWQVAAIRELQPFITSGSRGWAEYYSESGDAFIRITNMDRDCIYLDLSDLKFVKLPEHETEGRRTQLQDGDVLISITADIGISGYVDQAVPLPAYINQHVALVRFDNEKQNSKYISYFLASEAAQKRFMQGTDTGAKAGMSLSGVANTLLVLPSREEQDAIANALSDVDELLAKLDQLIAKKSDIKKGAMQELLTGKRRLEGFSTPWSTQAFSDLAPRRTERIDPKSQGLSEYCIELEHLEPGSGQIVGHTSTSVSSSLKTVFKPGDVLFGKLRAYLRKFALAERLGVCSTEIWALVAKEGVIRPDFLFQTVMRDDFIENASTAYGTHMPRSDWGIVSKFEVALPPLEEQKAIADVLSDMDADIKCLKEKRIKLADIKQGMMQQLLTGKIRLV
ncbi:restriction endonuclease subunit S [Burkholderia pseudomallei]|uniref:restriction endonuclease subunit S n=1 Tax=Burkholderia pseudomallei TaxID=28450 RepID=UPI0005369C18|nr:restriction endonuclease subunit S [Burkholderia pseudomallei]KGW85390.1 type I restriction modification DNA specificity domain protein [Burkholderia pseudomallei MSHR332]